MPKGKQKQKIKMTPEQMVELVKNIVKPLADRVGDLEKQEKQKVSSEVLPGQVDNREFAFISRSLYISKESPEKTQEINKALEDFMRKYKILSIKASLTRKW